jgi:hypothetical protein
MGVPHHLAATFATSPKGVMKTGKLLDLETYAIMRHPLAWQPKVMRAMFITCSRYGKKRLAMEFAITARLLAR